MRFIVLFLFLVSIVFGAKKDNVSAVNVTELPDGTAIVKIAFNYERPWEKAKRIRGTSGVEGINFPVPGNWEILSVSGYLRYEPSITLDKDTSSGVLSLNDSVVKQFKVFENSKTGVKFRINKNLFKQYNWFKIEMYQHLVKNKLNCEDKTSQDIWTEVDLAESYLEFHVRKKPIPEEIYSLTTHMIDTKQYEIEPINFVISNNVTDKELRYYALLSGAISNALPYRVAPISVSTDIDLKKHNVIVTTQADVKNRLSSLSKYFFFDNDPLYALNFEKEKIFLWTKDKTKEIPLYGDGVKIFKKGSFFSESIFFQGGKLPLKNLNLESESDLTFSFWFNNKKRKGSSILLSFNSYSLLLNQRSIGFSVTGRELYGNKLRLSKGWHHVVAKMSSTNIKENQLYIDGKHLRLKKIYGKKSQMMPSFSDTLVLGGKENSNKLLFRGAMDQFYIFNHPLTNAFISELYNRSKKYRSYSYNESLFISEKITHDINVIRNPLHQDKAILVIAPKNKEKIDTVIFGLNKKDLSLYKRQGLNIDSVTIPKPAKAYSSPKYIPVDTEITFKDLGYKTKVIKGVYPPPIDVNFKVYPDHFFGSKERIKLHLNYSFPTVLNGDSVANVFLNKKFAKQINILKASDSNSFALNMGGLIDFGEDKTLSAYLINKGKNNLHFEFSLVPLKKGGCAAYNTENLLVMVSDSSYFSLPESQRWIEMPYMKYVNTAAYPYSIYPDLQDTQLVLTDTKPDTIAAAMNFVFYLAHEIESYPYYIDVVKDLNKVDEHKQLVLFGTIFDKPLQLFSEQANISFNNKVMTKEYPFIKKLVERKEMSDEENLQKYEFVTKMRETNQLDNNLLVQMFQSPFDDEKTVLMFAAQTPKNLNVALNSLLSYSNRHFLEGDTLIYNPTDEKGISFDIADKYILSSMNILDRMSLEISLNPVFYLSILVVIVLIITWFLRSLLLDFKKSKHPHVEEE